MRNRREDEEANQRFYGRPLRNRDLVLPPATAVGTTGAPAPAAVAVWHQTLAKYTK